jgi:lambda repressor-like predicted transcriptional regulator
VSAGVPTSIAAAVAGRGSITIRAARRSDAVALRTLAALADRPLPDGQVLVAEVDGTVAAAISTGGDVVVADPFAVSLDLAELLGLRLRQLRAAA